MYKYFASGMSSFSLLNVVLSSGFGRLNKVILRFENMFWPEEPGMFASTADVLKTKNLLVSSWINGYRLTETNALVGYVTGDAAERMEGMEEEQLKQEGILYFLYFVYLFYYVCAFISLGFFAIEISI